MQITKINSMLVILLGSMSMGVLAENVTAGSKATASLVASCQIQAQSISFGALALPISAQSANSNMNILCSKETPYKIDLSYGLITTYWVLTGYSRGTHYMSEYNINGELLREQKYDFTSRQTSEKLAETVGCTVATDGKCYSTSGSGTAGVGNMYGSKGDKVAYNIFMPEDNSKVWNIGQNTYIGTGTGLSQTVPVRAQLIPSGSTAYPTPDMYTDTVTATITY